MNVVISHTSALLYLDQCFRLLPEKLFRTKPVPCEAPADQWAYRRGDFDAFHLDKFERVGKPLDVLIGSYRQNKRVAGVCHHAVGGELPPGSLLDAGGGVLVCSAPLVFVQLCQHLPLVRCIKLGHFICGAYSPEPSAKSGVVDRDPLSSKQELEEYVKSTRHLRGSRNASLALPWVLEGSASPKETELALPFYLPKQLGGYGFIAPSMNHKEPLNAAARAIEGSFNAFVDVYWPEQRFGFEYTSYSEHGDPKKIGEDERRKLALKLMGIDVELVTNQQLQDRRQLDILAQMLVSHGIPKARIAADPANIPVKERTSQVCSRTSLGCSCADWDVRGGRTEIDRERRR